MGTTCSRPPESLSQSRLASTLMLQAPASELGRQQSSQLVQALPCLPCTSTVAPGVHSASPLLPLPGVWCLSARARECRVGVLSPFRALPPIIVILGGPDQVGTVILSPSPASSHDGSWLSKDQGLPLVVT